MEETPFYATSGGQEADQGVIRTAEGEFQVEDVVKLLGGKIGHVGVVTKGMLKVGDEAELDRGCRRNVPCLPTTTALPICCTRRCAWSWGLMWSRRVLLSTQDRLRFDFTHFSALTPEEIQKVEEIVNEQIQKNLAVKVENMPIEEAKKDRGSRAVWREIRRYRPGGQHGRFLHRVLRRYPCVQYRRDHRL